LMSPVKKKFKSDIKKVKNKSERKTYNGAGTVRR